jgi:cell division protein FtsQ
MSRGRNRSPAKRFRIALPPTWWRWSLRAMIGLLIILGSTWSYRWLVNPQNLPLQQVVMRAPFQHVPKKLLDQHLAPYLKRNFVTLNAGQLQRALRLLPWVKSVQVQRVWPDTLVLTIEEQQPLARWGEVGVVNALGEIFHPDAASIPPGLPEFSGPTDMAKSMAVHYQQFQATLDKEKLKIKAVRVNLRHAWELQLDNGTVIKLGQGQHQERLALVVKAWRLLTKQRSKILKTVDARYPNGIAVN